MSDHDTESTVDIVIIPNLHDLGDNFNVRRALPSKARRMVGPFVFLDQMGPATFAPGRGIDVRPHPHIGLATVSYLFEGEILHRDSIGSVQTIRAGDLNWMTAGRGIVHSERSPADSRARGSNLSGLQCWVALPREHEEIEPGFVHVPKDDLPVESAEGITTRIIAGSFFGLSSPVPTLSPLFYVDLQIEPGARISMPAEYAEQAIYIASGQLDLGRDGIFDTSRLIVLKPGASVTLACAGNTPTRIMLLGGDALDGPRYISWNFVSSSLDRIKQAQDDWRNQSFPKVPGETEFIPLPT